MYNRDHFLELGGFDQDLFVPFYVEDDDLLYRAWKRGFIVLYEPRACVFHYHQHPTAIASRYASGLRARVGIRNRLIYTWKNVHDRKMLAQHLVRTCIQVLVPDLRYHLSLIDALKVLKVVLQKRRREQEASRRSDVEVLQAIRSHTHCPIEKVEET